MGDLVRKIGEVKIKEFQDNFDEILDEHREKADQGGYHGELKFKKEKGKMIIFVELD
jgi:hypothetical protein